MSGDVIETVVEILEEFHPLGLASCDFLWLTEILEVFVICADHDGMISAKEIQATTFEAVYNGCHFFIMDVIVLFRREESSRVECNWVSSICEFLANDDTESEIGCVSIHKELFRPIWGSENWIGATYVFYCVKAGLFVCSPFPFIRFLSYL